MNRGTWAGLGLAAGLATLVIVAFTRDPEEQFRRAEDLINMDSPQAQSATASVFRSYGPQASVIRTQAILAERKGEAGAARGLMQIADRWSRRDRFTQTWLLQNSVATGRYAEGLIHATVIIRRNPEAASEVFPTIQFILKQPGGPEAVAQAMEERPAWRGPFLEQLARGGDDESMIALLAALQRSSAPPVHGEVSVFLARKLEAGEGLQARDLAHRFSPLAAALKRNAIYNGDFADVPSAHPFDWRRAELPIGSVEYFAPPGRGQDLALRISYDGFSPIQPIYQAILTAPGRHTFSGEGMTLTPGARDRFRWTILCYGDNRTLLKIMPTLEPEWRRFTATFEVPQQGCATQLLILNGAAGGRRSDLQAFFDKLSITPSTSGPTP